MLFSEEINLRQEHQFIQLEHSMFSFYVLYSCQIQFFIPYRILLWHFLTQSAPQSWYLCQILLLGIVDFIKTIMFAIVFSNQNIILMTAMYISLMLAHSLCLNDMRLHLLSVYVIPHPNSKIPLTTWSTWSLDLSVTRSFDQESPEGCSNPNYYDPFPPSEGAP